MERTRINNYNLVARLYDVLASVYSAGQITACLLYTSDAADE